MDEQRPVLARSLIRAIRGHFPAASTYLIFMLAKLAVLIAIGSVLCLMPAHAADPKIAAEAVNAFGVDLYHTCATGEDNLLFSPYSIQSALAMSYAGADGDTRTEMQHALHFPADSDALHEGFGALTQKLSEITAQSLKDVQIAKKKWGPRVPTEFILANRLFVQRGSEFLPPFLRVLKKSYAVTPGEADFQKNPEKARAEINRWVAERTKDRIREVIPKGALSAATRITLVNAFYLRAPWYPDFTKAYTQNQTFLVRGRDAVDVPTMRGEIYCRCARREGFQIAALRSFNESLQFIVLLPDKPDGLPALEHKLTPELLAECAHLPIENVMWELPKFRLEPPTLPLGQHLRALGMKAAFNDPPGSSDLGRMISGKTGTPLAIDTVVHRSFLSIDEKGMEAGAASVVITAVGIEPKPMVMKVDHPFLFAVQHVESGACLFLGRVTDPR